MGVMFCMMDQRQSSDGHFTTECVYSHASEPQDEAKALLDDCASETDSQAKYDKQQSLEKLLRLLRLHRSLINPIPRPTPEVLRVLVLELLRNLEGGGGVLRIT
jgi:hypothetical protein